MISELRVEDASRACVPWWGQVEALKDLERIEFKPGLNILWGPNGSGKSTILTAVARMLHAEQGGKTTVTQHSVSEMFGGMFGGLMREGKTDEERQRAEYRGGLVPVHDGQAVMYFDPGKSVGLMGGAFDDDFFGEGLLNLTRKASAGQTTLEKMNSILGVLLGKVEWPEVAWRFDPKRVNSLWKARGKIVGESLAATIDKGQPTVILDEPDRSLDIPYQYGVWKRIPQDAGDFQVIVATHSLFAVNIPGAHYIELKEGYLEGCRRAALDTFGGGEKS